MRQKPLNKFRAPYLDYDIPLNLAPGRKLKRRLLSDLQRKNLRLRNKKAVKRLELKENNFKKTKERSLLSTLSSLSKDVLLLSKKTNSASSLSSPSLSSLSVGRQKRQRQRNQQNKFSERKDLTLSYLSHSKSKNKRLVLQDFPSLFFLSTKKKGSGYKKREFILNSYRVASSVENKGIKEKVSFFPVLDREKKNRETTSVVQGLNLSANRKRVSFQSGVFKNVVERRLDSGKRTTPFKADLLERKKVSFIYGDLAFKVIRRMAKRVSGEEKGGASLKGTCFHTQKLLYLLESRLDILLFKIRFFPTLLASRQAIKNGLVRVNSATVTTPSYQLKGGDFIKCGTEKGNNQQQVKQKAFSNALSKVNNRLRTETGFKDVGFAERGVASSVQNLRVSPLESKLFSLLTLYLCNKELQTKQLGLKQSTFSGFALREKNALVLASSRTQTNNQHQPTKKALLGGVEGEGFFLSNINKRKQLPPVFDGLENRQKESCLFSSLYGQERKWGDKRNPMKPLNVEVSYLSLSAIYLYPPQKVTFPAYIDLDTLFKSLS